VLLVTQNNYLAIETLKSQELCGGYPREGCPDDEHFTLAYQGFSGSRYELTVIARAGQSEAAFVAARSSASEG